MYHYMYWVSLLYKILYTYLGTTVVCMYDREYIIGTCYGARGAVRLAYAYVQLYRI